MDKNKTEDSFSQECSTYGMITSERLLGRYKINVPQNHLIAAIKEPCSFYHRLLQVPLRNIYNGIIMQQAYDYHTYVQKLYIDYLLSGKISQEEEAQGDALHEDLEDQRQELLALGEEFHKGQTKHDFLIASSQAVLLEITQRFNAELEHAIKALKNTLKEIPR